MKPKFQLKVERPLRVSGKPNLKAEAIVKRKNINKKFLGKVVIAQVMFSGKRITSHMAPKAAVENIKNLIVSSTEKGSQDSHSLLDAYRRFDKYLTNEKIKQPVAMLADGHGSRFDFKVLQFLREKNINLFITPPDTTGVTQL